MPAHYVPPRMHVCLLVRPVFIKEYCANHGRGGRIISLLAYIHRATESSSVLPSPRLWLPEIIKDWATASRVTSSVQ